MNEEQLKQLQILSEEMNKIQIEMSKSQQTNDTQSMNHYLSEMTRINNMIQSLYNTIK